MALKAHEQLDPRTGARIVRLTPPPALHYHQYCYGQWMTPDCRALLVFGLRELQRDSPVDLYRVNIDGTGYRRIAENAGWSTVSIDGTVAYAGSGGSILRIPLDGSGGTETIFRSDRYQGMFANAQTLDGTYLFCHAQGAPRGHELVRIDLRTGAADVLFETDYLMHVHLHDEGAGRLLATVRPPDLEWGIYTFDRDGRDFQKLPFTRSTNHFASLGNTGKVVTTVHSGGKAIEIARPGETEFETLVEGEGFWHPTSDATGEWLACDTNWPDTGLMLVHVPTKQYRLLCFTGASGGHPQWTHAHPRMAYNAEYVVYDSDISGTAQTYAVFVPPELKAEMRG
jgi:hypothetical protein